MTDQAKVHPNRELVDQRSDDYASGDADFEGVIVLDGWDECILGTVDFDQAFKVVYSTRKIIEGLRKDMTPEEADEYFDYNIRCLYAGKYTPILLDDEWFE